MHSKHYGFPAILLRLLIVTVLFGLTVGGPDPALADPVPGPGSEITGIVFRDFNGNGLRDLNASIPNVGAGNNQDAGVAPLASDEGLGGVTVTAFCVTNLGGDGLAGTADDVITAFGPVQSAADGSYTIATSGVVAVPAPAQSCRVEFTGLPAGYEPSAHGAGAGTTSGTSVQFVAPGTSNVSYGVNRPADYCQDNPLLITNCFKFGDQVNGDNKNEAAALSFPYNAGSARTTGGAPYDDFDAPTTHAIEIPAKEIGSTFALTFRASTGDLYLGAYMKRHAGFGPGADGVLNNADDPVTIYRYNIKTGLINARFVVPGPSTNRHDVNDYLHDDGTVSWAAIGRTSLGDITLSASGAVLYAVNLENRTLYALNADTGVAVASQAVPTANIPTPGDASATCAPDDVHPFALRFYNGKLYAGLICSAESTQRLTALRAYVYEVDPVTLAFAATPVLQFPLNYPRNQATSKPNQPADWNPWAPTFKTIPANFNDTGGSAPVYPQPMLADLTFDANGNMILGLRDRFGDQVGNKTPSNPADPSLFYIGVGVGDTLKACFDGSGWTLESNSRCGGEGAGPINNGEGPGNGEFYFGDDYNNLHDEVTNGGLVVVPGYPEVVVTAIEPILFPPATASVVADGGVRHFNNNSGAANSAYRVYDSTFVNVNLFAKANGLGDLEVLCDAAPLEIGNRVWHDVNHNGVQDAGEPPLAGVTVQLFQNNQPVATAVTNSSGEYYFVGNPEPDPDPSDYIGIVVGGIQPNQTNYEIRINTTQPALANYLLTLPNADPSVDGDIRDSDGTQNGNNALFAIPTSGGPGQIRHTYDFGFWIPGPDIRLIKYTNGEDADLPTGPEVGYGDVVTWTYDITNTGSLTLTDVTLVDNIEGSISCPKVLLLPGEGMTCVLTGIATTLGQYANTAVVTGTPTIFPEERVTDTNPSHYLTRPFSLGNKVWLDDGAGGGVANDGVQNGGEAGIGNVTVNLLDGAGNPVLSSNQQPISTVTAADGCYLFDNLRRGDYIVEIASANFGAGQPLFHFTSSTGNSIGGAAPVPNTDIDLDDNGNDTPINGAIRSGVVTLSLNSEPLGEALCGAGTGAALDKNSNLTVDFGFWIPGPDIRLIKYTNGEDADLPTGPEVGYGDVVTWTYDITNTGSLTLTDVTLVDNIEGSISCPKVLLLPGEGMTCVLTGIATTLGQYANTAVVTGTPTIFPEERVTDTNPSHYLTRPFSLGNKVWLDDGAGGGVANDGVQNGGEAGIGNVTVNLLDGAGNPVLSSNQQPISTVTAADGCYLFDNLRRGDYIVEIASANFGAGQPLFHFTSSTGNSIGGAAPVPNTDIDLDDNGNDTPINGAIRSGVVTLSLNSEPLGEALCGAGTGAALDKNSNLTVDFGFLAPVSVGDFVWFDNNQNGLQDAGEGGVPNVSVSIFRADGTPASDVTGTAVPAQLTDANGGYLFTNLPPGSYYVVFNRATLPAGYTITTPNAGADDAIDSDASISTGQTAPTPFLPSNTSDITLDMGIIQLQGVRVGDYVWIDKNINGQQDAGEPGVPNVTVTLFNASNDQQLGVKQTDTSGLYLFDDLPPGQYYVIFDLATLPPGFKVTTQNATGVSDELDSDADLVTGRSGNSRTLANGEEDLTLDMGIYRLLSLGNLVWKDMAGGNTASPQFNNGLVDPGEPGLAGVEVRLRTISDTLLMTMTTDISGTYRFTDLLPGQYIVEIVVPDGYSSSTGGTAGAPTGPYEPAPDPDNNIDNDDNGTGLPNSLVIRSLPVTLSMGDEPADNGTYNPTVDFGVCADCRSVQAVAAIGDFVWRDQTCDGIQDINSVPVPNVVVRLYKANGQLVGTQLTNASGKYLFTGLEPGLYYLEFDRPTLQPPVDFGPAKQGTNIEFDSDAVPIAVNSPTARTETTELVADETDISWDAGLCPALSEPPTDEPALSGPVFLPFVSR